ncbi:allophanate hydrolase [Pseudonocardia endophytica]|nr:allophanate hydrolase [Pseudonocardia endophytica]
MSPTSMPGATPALEILEPGLETTVQDYPGRVGRQALGFFPSGPVDHLAFRVANRLVSNPPGAAALEIPLGRFQASVMCPGLVAVTGPDTTITLNDEPIPQWESVPVVTGDLLTCDRIRGPGHRLYLAIAGGIAVPEVFGSRSTFLVPGIGGYNGRALEQADILDAEIPGRRPPTRRLPTSLRPAYTDQWDVEVVRGPHADPDFLTPGDIDVLFGSSWRCDLNSDRVGIRFNPHRFEWARESSGVAGGHPSNLLDNSYPLGGILAYGDVLTILGPDSNTSGGFAVVATVAQAALWKVGQFRPGRDRVRFREVDLEQAGALARHVAHVLDDRHFERA